MWALRKIEIKRKTYTYNQKTTSGKSVIHREERRTREINTDVTYWRQMKKAEKVNNLLKRVSVKRFQSREEEGG